MFWTFAFWNTPGRPEWFPAFTGGIFGVLVSLALLLARYWRAHGKALKDRDQWKDAHALLGSQLQPRLRTATQHHVDRIVAAASEALHNTTAKAVLDKVRGLIVDLVQSHRDLHLNHSEVISNALAVLSEIDSHAVPGVVPEPIESLPPAEPIASVPPDPTPEPLCAAPPTADPAATPVSLPAGQDATAGSLQPKSEVNS